jgi:prolyl 4-hydroxylase
MPVLFGGLIWRKLVTRSLTNICSDSTLVTDYIENRTERAQGVRILTVFLYLNDVEEGGGTRFTDLDITVQPKKGRALIWPSVLDANPDVKDDRTHHEALPVKKGIKYGANAWIHQRDFKIPHATACI